MTAKVPAITLAFWMIKICATTLGETGGDALSMSLNLGYALSSVIVFGIFGLFLTAQIAATQFHPFLYWTVVVATTTAGTTTSDYIDRTLGLGYTASSILLLSTLVVVLIAWRLTTGSISVDNISKPADELFYWCAILISNTLGTAAGDFIASDMGMGFKKGALVFAVLLSLVLVLRKVRCIPKSAIFWYAYILTRPLGATLGDMLTKPFTDGGLNLNRIASSLALAAVMVIAIYVSPSGQAKKGPTN